MLSAPSLYSVGMVTLHPNDKYDVSSESLPMADRQIMRSLSHILADHKVVSGTLTAISVSVSLVVM